MTDARPNDKLTNKKEPVLIKSKQRVKKHGEVFTPQWVIDKMMGIPGIEEKARDVFATFLEPSAGEGAFLLAIQNLKLQAVTDKYSEDAWGRYALWALSSIYGIEFLEDNLGIARQNMLDGFAHWYETAHREPIDEQSDLYQSARTIIWANIVQGDALAHQNAVGEDITFSRWKPTDDTHRQVRRITFAYASLLRDESQKESNIQVSWLDAGGKPGSFAETDGDDEDVSMVQAYAVADIEQVWREEKKTADGTKEDFMFDVVIGNPPYQEEAKGTSSSDDPIYHLFMDEAYKLAYKVSFITPARFLFNAGKTPKIWNEKMLSDAHLKIVYYERDSSKVFANTSIPGGVVVTYRDNSSISGGIGHFTGFTQLEKIVKKVVAEGFDSIQGIIYPQSKFDLEKLFADYPEYKTKIGNEGKDKRFRPNAMEVLSVFTHQKQNTSDIKVLGLVNRQRTFRYIPRKYVEISDWVDKYKVVVSASNGASGALEDSAARLISKPELGDKQMGFTQTFIGFGQFDAVEEAQNLLKYINTKFSRVLLGVLKVTPRNTVETWKYVPLQDFTPASDIDWSRSVAEIDQQLYRKYGLDEAEIEFIETHVKEMG